MTPTTRCKFHCQEITQTEWGATRVKLTAAYPNDADGFKHSAEDHAFFSATPAGTIELTINNPFGAELFQPGKDFYVDFVEAPKLEPVEA